MSKRIQKTAPRANPDQRSDRALGWVGKDGTFTPVCDMTDEHLINATDYIRRKIMSAKLATGITSLSMLTLQYLEQETKWRGLEFYTKEI